MAFAEALNRRARESIEELLPIFAVWQREGALEDRIGEFTREWRAARNLQIAGGMVDWIGAALHETFEWWLLATAEAQAILNKDEVGLGPLIDADGPMRFFVNQTASVRTPEPLPDLPAWRPSETELISVRESRSMSERRNNSAKPLGSNPTVGSSRCISTGLSITRLTGDTSLISRSAQVTKTGKQFVTRCSMWASCWASCRVPLIRRDARQGPRIGSRAVPAPGRNKCGFSR